MRIEAIMHKGAVCARPDDTMQHIAGLMSRNQLGALPVYDGDVLAGIVSERDLLRAMADDHMPEHAPVARYMTRRVVTIRSDEDSDVAATRMVENGIRHLPVVDGGHLVGMLSVRDLVKLELWPRLSGRVTG